MLGKQGLRGLVIIYRSTRAAGIVRLHLRTDLLQLLPPDRQQSLPISPLCGALLGTR